MAWQARRDTESDARSENPTLASGEIGIITDRNKVVIGDGSTAYQSLSALLPTGMILPFGGTTAPDGFLDCDGSAVSRTTYADLFAAIGTTWGVGDGSTTFNVPDLRGIGLRGSGQHGSRTKADSTAYDGGSVGNEQNDQMQGHIHYAGAGFTNTRAFVYGDDTSEAPGNAVDRVTLGSATGTIQPETSGARSDGTNGTPRTGDETRGATSSVLFVIKT